MKTRITFCFSIFFCIMLFSFSTCAYAKPSKAKITKAYRECIANHAPDRSNAPKRVVKYVDINNDGIIEMLYIYYGEKDWFYPTCEVYTYRKGKVVLAGASGGVQVVYYSKSNKRLCIQTRAYIATRHNIFKLAKGKLKAVVSYHPGGQYGNPGNKAEKYINGRRIIISEAKYKKIIDRISKWKRIFVWE